MLICVKNIREDFKVIYRKAACLSSVRNLFNTNQNTERSEGGVYENRIS